MGFNTTIIVVVSNIFSGFLLIAIEVVAGSPSHQLSNDVRVKSWIIPKSSICLPTSMLSPPTSDVHAEVVNGRIELGHTMAGNISRRAKLGYVLVGLAMEKWKIIEQEAPVCEIWGSAPLRYLRNGTAADMTGRLIGCCPTYLVRPLSTLLRSAPPPLWVILPLKSPRTETLAATDLFPGQPNIDEPLGSALSAGSDYFQPPT